MWLDGREFPCKLSVLAQRRGDTGDVRASGIMIVILHSRNCYKTAASSRHDLLTAFNGNVEVGLVEAESAKAWPAPEVEWDDLLIILYDGSTFPNEGALFIDAYLKQRGESAMLLPVAVDVGAQKPPKPAEHIKALLFDTDAGGESGRLVNRAGGMLGLRLQGRHTKIFISYRQMDGVEIAEQLKSHLDHLGLHTFLDQAKEFDGHPTILPGSEVQKEIDEALQSANLVLLIDTPRALESPWIKHEIDTADGLLLPVLPICFREPRDPKKGTRFRSLLALQRWLMFQTPAPGRDPLAAPQLDEIVREAEMYLCEIFRRRCRIPFIVKKEFESQGFNWETLNQKLLMFASSRTGGRITTRVVSHCSIFDEIYEPAIKRFQTYLNDAGHPNHSLFIYGGEEVLPDHVVMELARHHAGFVVILHHQELATLISSRFTMLSAA